MNWKLSLSQVITVLTVIVGFVVNYATTQSSVAELAKAQERQQIQITLMDREGTHASQRGIDKDAEFTKANERRISVLEERASRADPTLEEIKVNVEWMKKWMDSHSKP